MKNNYIYLYNKLIELARDKNLYKDFTKQDEFSDRLIFFLIHFALFFKAFKNEDNKETLQNIYDFIFRQLELSIREIGYGDQSINKKMKDYINTFHAIVSDVHFWDDLDIKKKKEIILNFLGNFNNIDELVEYFDNFIENLSKKTLNSYLKSVINQ